MGAYLDVQSVNSKIGDEMTIIEQLSNEMEAQGLSQREVARRSHLHFNTLNKVLGEKVSPKLITIQKIAKVLGKKMEIELV